MECNVDLQHTWKKKCQNIQRKKRQRYLRKYQEEWPCIGPSPAQGESYAHCSLCSVHFMIKYCKIFHYIFKFVHVYMYFIDYVGHATVYIF